VVVGGGDSALQEALVLSDYCANVQIVHHRSEFTAHPRWQHALRACSNVTVMPMTELTAIEGGDVVEAVRLRSLTDANARTMPCSGVFVYVGLVPAVSFLPESVPRDPSGAVVTSDRLETSLDNVFAAGAVRAGYQGTLSDAVRDAERAANAMLHDLRD
jgi:thioredoxin reductase (NADPH)